MDVLLSFLNSLPGAAGQGLIWGVMAIGVYITYRILDVADLTVDGSLATGGAVCALLIRLGVYPWLALLAAVLSGAVIFENSAHTLSMDLISESLSIFPVFSKASSLMPL